MNGDWDIFNGEEDEELQSSVPSGSKDTILFCIDASQSMHELQEIDKERKSPLQAALEAALQIEKRKVVTGPNDIVGILLYNTRERSSDNLGPNSFLLQELKQIDAERILALKQIVEDAEQDPEFLRQNYAPMSSGSAELAQVVATCNWVLKEGSPKAGVKRIFWITNQDDPHPKSKTAVQAFQTRVNDLRTNGADITAFCLGTSETFDKKKFYAEALSRSQDSTPSASLVPELEIIPNFRQLIELVKRRDSPKRAFFSVPLHLGPGFTIGVKGYGLVTEQRKGSYTYYANVGENYKETNSRTVYFDADFESEMDRNSIMFGMSLGSSDEPMTRDAGVQDKVFFTAEEVASFRTLGLAPGFKLLGFKDPSELHFEDNVKHSLFLYPSEDVYAGSTRTFAALLKSMLSKDKIGLVLGIGRRNTAPQFYALLPQAEVLDEQDNQIEPPGLHLIPLPFADDIRNASVDKALQASDKLKASARAWIDKLSIKGGYIPSKYPNPALQLHYAQLQALAFNEPFDIEEFEDESLPSYDAMHKRAGALLKEWKNAVAEDPAQGLVEPTVGTKRKAVDVLPKDEGEVRQRWGNGTLDKLKVDELKEFLKSKGQAVSGKKADLLKRVSEWLDDHP